MSERRVGPWFWMILFLPFGATSGFVSVTLGSVLQKQGMSDAVIASLVALNLLPHTWKVFWSPIVDSTWKRKNWYVLANLASCAAIFGIAFTPITKANIGILETLIFVNSFAITLVGMAVEGLMAHATPPDQRGRAAGWFQAGNLGGSGVGGGVALFIAEHVSTQAAFIALAVLLLACTLALRAVPETPREVLVTTNAPGFGARVIAALRNVWALLGALVRDLWSTFGSRLGIVAIALVFLPIGSGAASGLFSGELAKQWGVSPDVVATTTGLLGGTIAAIGCLAGGWFSDRLGRRVAYATSGAILAVIAAAWAVLPPTPTMYVTFVMLYQFASGIAYACFTGFVLEVIGKGAAATKYNFLASLSNIPIAYMTKVDGWASTEYGPANMLLVDGASEIAGIVIFVLLIVILRPPKVTAEPDAPAPPSELPSARIVEKK